MNGPKLFAPLTIGNLTLANRIVIAPMCQYSASNGCMNDWHQIHLGQLALSGAALLTIFVQGFANIGISLGFGTIVFSHIMFCLSFVVVTVRARIQSLDGLVVAQARVPTDHGIPGLDFRCVIEDHVSSDSEIVAAMSGLAA